MFSYKIMVNTWFMTICVANSKRQCNDCLRKSEYSPKAFYSHITGNKTGIEPFRIALTSLLEFEKTIKNTEIRIVGASERLRMIYSRLLRYGYVTTNIVYSDGKEKDILYKVV